MAREGPYAIALDGGGNANLTGRTASPNFPVTPGAVRSTLGAGYDAFAVKLSAAGDAFGYSTFLGGSGTDVGNGVAASAAGEAVFTGATDSGSFPVTAGAYDPTANGGQDAFVTRLSPLGSLAFSTYLGSAGSDQGSDIALQPTGHAVVAGATDDAGFPPPAARMTAPTTAAASRMASCRDGCGTRPAAGGRA